MIDKKEDAGFVGRWSRLKQEARRSGTQHAPEPEATPAEIDAKAAAAGNEEDFDPSRLEIPLPSLDDIIPGMNMSPFFQHGVPEVLRNAALRKLWVVDPVIRDFENPAREYAYDWNIPGGVPGSGDIVGDQDIASLLRDLTGGRGDAPVEDIPSQLASNEASNHLADAKEDKHDPVPPLSGDPASQTPESLQAQDLEAVASIQNRSVEVFAVAKEQSLRRRHGGALPESGA
jgi:hypothetical protein